MKKYWFVICKKDNEMYQTEDRNNPGRFVMDDRQTKYGIFFEKKYADNFAKNLSKENAGYDVHILETVEGVFAPPPKETIFKKWNENGEYVPA